MAEKKSLNIHQRLDKIRAAVPYLKKDKTIRIKTKSGSTFEYQAITHDAVTAAVREYFLEFEVSFIPRLTAHSEEGARTCAEVTVSFYCSDNPEDFIDMPVYAFGDDGGDKGPGKALSYATKYALLKVLMLETGESDESRTFMGDDPIAETQLKTLEKLARETDTDIETFLSFVNSQKGTTYTKLENIIKSDFPFCKAKLEAKATSREAASA